MTDSNAGNRDHIDSNEQHDGEPTHEQKQAAANVLRAAGAKVSFVPVMPAAEALKDPAAVRKYAEHIRPLLLACASDAGEVYVDAMSAALAIMVLEACSDKPSMSIFGAIAQLANVGAVQMLSRTFGKKVHWPDERPLYEAINLFLEQSDLAAASAGSADNEEPN